jgi:hypothetical protein
MITKIFAVGVISILLAITPAFAAPPVREAAFVCPVLGGHAGENGNSGVIVPIFGGDYTVVGPHIWVPPQAGNWGYPSTVHGSPGDPGYTAIWLESNAP